MLVFAPELLGGLNINLLTSLRSAAQEDDEGGSISPKVDSVAGTEVETKFHDAETYALRGETTLAEPVESGDNSCAGARFKRLVPSLKWIAAAAVDVLL